jgi:hypothetical protein
MPRTESKTYEVQIVAGIFSTREIDDKRKEGFPNLDIPRQNIQMVVKLDSKQAKEAFTGAVVEAIRAGKIQVAAHNVTDPAFIIDASDAPKIRAKSFVG